MNSNGDQLSFLFARFLPPAPGFAASAFSFCFDLWRFFLFSRLTASLLLFFTPSFPRVPVASDFPLGLRARWLLHLTFD